MTSGRSSHYRLTALVIGVALAAAACTPANTASETTQPASSSTVAETTTSAPLGEGVFLGADGVVTTVTDTSRIVSLTGDITEIIFEVGLGDSVVAVDIATTYPPEANELKRSGSNLGFGQALGRPHDGPDVAGNILCLCPNDHVRFDRGAITVQDDGAIVGMDGSFEGLLRTVKGHTVDDKFLAYHRDLFGSLP